MLEGCEMVSIGCSAFLMEGRMSDLIMFFKVTKHERLRIIL